MVKKKVIPSAKLRAMVAKWEDDSPVPVTESERRAYESGLLDSLPYWVEMLKK